MTSFDVLFNPGFIMLTTIKVYFGMTSLEAFREFKELSHDELVEIYNAVTEVTE